MANPDRGEQQIDVNGLTYTLKLSMMAARQLQKRNKGKTIGELMSAASRLDYDAIGELMFGLLQEHHAKDFPNMKAVDELIDAAGGPRVFFEYCERLEAIAAASKAPGVEGAEENPPTAQAGTGDSSELRLAASA